MRYFLIAGEASGDIHAAGLIEALKREDEQAQFAFLGGDLMERASGVKPVIHYREMAYMGIVEVVKHARAILNNMRCAKSAIEQFRPDCLILIDYPSFNLKMAKFAKKLGIKVVYYISPKVWAWKEWRVKTIKRVIDLMLVIFPFEVPFYQKHGFQAHYVGNPSVEEVDRILKEVPSRQEFLRQNNLQDKPLIALLPGSRLSEIRTNMEIMNDAVSSFPQYQAVVAGAPGIDRELYRQFTGLPVVFDQTFALLAHSHAALVTSGTATLETALVGVPQVAMYRHNGKKFMLWAKEHVLKVKYVTLPNLIAGREIIPELLFHLCTPDTVSETLGRLLPDKQPRQQMLANYAEMRRILGCKNAPAEAAKLICGKLEVDNSTKNS